MRNNQRRSTANRSRMYYLLVRQGVHSTVDQPNHPSIRAALPTTWPMAAPKGTKCRIPDQSSLTTGRVRLQGMQHIRIEHSRLACTKQYAQHMSIEPMQTRRALLISQPSNRPRLCSRGSSFGLQGLDSCSTHKTDESRQSVFS